MRDEEQVQAAVNRGAEIMADVEDLLAQARDKLSNELPEVFEALRQNEVIGYLEANELSDDARGQSGYISTTRAGVFAFHTQLTDRSRELDLEQYLPQPRSGGGGR